MALRSEHICAELFPFACKRGRMVLNDEDSCSTVRRFDFTSRIPGNEKLSHPKASSTDVNQADILLSRDCGSACYFTGRVGDTSSAS